MIFPTMTQYNQKSHQDRTEEYSANVYQVNIFHCNIDIVGCNFYLTLG